MNKIKVENVGVMFEESLIYVYYFKNDKRRRRKIPMREMLTRSKDEIYAELKNKHEELLSKIDHKVMQRVIDSVVNKKIPIEDKKDLNLNLLSDVELEKVKKEMDKKFIENQVTKESKDFEYDTRVDYASLGGNAEYEDDGFIEFVVMELRSSKKKRSLIESPDNFNTLETQLSTSNSKSYSKNMHRQNAIKYSNMLNSLVPSNDYDSILSTLSQLAEFLSISTEDMLTSFPSDKFIKAFLALLSIPEPEIIILSCRSLSNLIEASPSSLVQIVHNNGINILTQKLLSIEYIDLAESVLSILDKISGEYPSLVLQEDAVISCLTYIDFFNIHVQRTSMSICANSFRGLEKAHRYETNSLHSRNITNTDSTKKPIITIVKEIVPHLERLITYSDTRLVENAVRSISRIVEWAQKLSESEFEDLISPQLISTIVHAFNSTTNQSSTNPSIFIMFIKILAIISKTSDKYAGTLVGELNVLPTVMFVLIGRYEILDHEKNSLESLVVQKMATQPPDQVVAILTLVCNILPALPNDKNWNLNVESLETEVNLIDSQEKSLKRLNILNEQSVIFEKLIQIFPIVSDIFGVTVNLAIRRKCLEFISKFVWFSNVEVIKQVNLNSLGKFISGLIGLYHNYEHFKGKDLWEMKSFVSVGLQVSYVLVNRDCPTFKVYFQREGVANEIKKMLTYEEHEIIPTSTVEEPSNRNMNSMLMSIVEDFNKLDEQLDTREGGSGSESDSNMSAMFSNVRTAFESFRQEHIGESRVAQQAVAKNIKSINDELFSNDQFTEWTKWICKDILEKMNQSGSEKEDLTSILIDIKNSLENDSTSSADQLLKFARYLAGNQNTSGLTGFEIIESGLISGLVSYLTRNSIAENGELHNTVTLETRIATFYSIFLNYSNSNHQSSAIYIDGAFINLVSRLQESLSRSESLVVSKACPSSEGSKTQNSVMALLNSLSGMSSSSNQKDDLVPSLQLAKQIRIKLVAENPEFFLKQYHTVVIGVHAVATFRALEEFLRIKATSSSPGTAVEKSELHEINMDIDCEDDFDEEDDEYDLEEDDDIDDVYDLEEEGINLSDMLIESEENSRQSRKRSESAGSAKEIIQSEESKPISSVSKDSVVEFLLDSPKKSKIPKGSKKQKKSSNELPTVKTYASAAKQIEYSIVFMIDGEEISQDSTIFGALYKHEQSKSSNKKTNPNIWNELYTIKFKRVEPLQKIAEANFSMESIIGDNYPFRKFENDLSDFDSQSSSILRLLGILNELNSRWITLIPWCNPDTEEIPKLISITSSAFQNNKITAKLNKQLDEPLIVASRVLPTWCHAICYDFPFLVPFETRMIYLQSFSFGYSRNMARWQQNSESNSLSENPMLGRIQRQKIRISRHRILESVIKVMESYGHTQALLEVEFFDEVGTGLGPTLEFYALACREFRLKAGVRIGGSNVCMWRSDDAYKSQNSSLDSHEIKDYMNSLFPSAVSSSLSNPKLMTLFTALGTLVAKALLDSRVLDFPFHSLFLNMAVFGHASIGSMSAIKLLDDNLFKSLQLLNKFKIRAHKIKADKDINDEEKAVLLQNIAIDGCKLDDLCLDFTLPGYHEFNLVENGKNIMVNADNIQEYINSVIDYTVGSGISRQVKSFRKGFCKVFPIQDLHSFSVKELGILMGESLLDDWRIETIKDCILADHGYHKDSRVISDLARMMSEFSMEDRRLFLQFVTGCPRLPYGGFKGLAPPLTVVRKTAESHMKADDYLPSVMTCVNYLKIPEYSSLKVMKERFELAMFEGQGCFHLS